MVSSLDFFSQFGITYTYICKYFLLASEILGTYAGPSNLAKPSKFDNYVLYKQEKDPYGNEPAAGYSNRYRLERYSKNDLKIIGKPNEGINGIVAVSKEMGKQCEYDLLRVALIMIKH